MSRRVQYVGEVITNEEAERRGAGYDAQGLTYLFDLDFNRNNDNLYTVGWMILTISNLYTVGWMILTWFEIKTLTKTEGAA